VAYTGNRNASEEVADDEVGICTLLEEEELRNQSPEHGEYLGCAEVAEEGALVGCFKDMSVHEIPHGNH